MLAGRKVFSIAAGTRHSVAASELGVAYAWGNGDSGQLGLPQDSLDCVPLPRLIEPFLSLGPSLIAAGGSHTIVTTATTPYLQHRLDNLDPVNSALRRNNVKKLKQDEYAGVAVPSTNELCTTNLALMCGWVQASTLY